MQNPQLTPDDAQVSPLLIGHSTIVQFERKPTGGRQLYDELYQQNPELAMWLRRRAVQLAPDIDDREVIATLALELFGIFNNHLTVQELSQRLNPSS
jgi:hypothetical protein